MGLLALSSAWPNVLYQKLCKIRQIKKYNHYHYHFYIYVKVAERQLIFLALFLFSNFDKLLYLYILWLSKSSKDLAQNILVLTLQAPAVGKS